MRADAAGLLPHRQRQTTVARRLTSPLPNKGHLKSVQLLHELGASLTATDYDGHTPIHLAEGHLEVTKWLRAQRAAFP